MRVKSNAKVSTSTPAGAKARMSALTFSNLAGVRLMMSTLMPCRASSCAKASPIPEVAPVTTAHRPYVVTLRVGRVARSPKYRRSLMTWTAAVASPRTQTGCCQTPVHATKGPRTASRGTVTLATKDSKAFSFTSNPIAWLAFAFSCFCREEGRKG